MDVIQALFGQRNPAYRAASGFSDSPHLFYSGWKPNGEWFLLYQIGFGGVPARPLGDGPDCHCLFPAIKSIPTENIELYFPIIVEANEAVADSGGAGFYRGGNAQRTLYRFLCAGEVSIHDDRWLTKPYGTPSAAQHYEILPSKMDHLDVQPGDVLEWVTWGGGGLGDPLTRPAETVALEVHRGLVTLPGARDKYGVVVNAADFSLTFTRYNFESVSCRMVNDVMSKSCAFPGEHFIHISPPVSMQDCSLNSLPQNFRSREKVTRE
ncbi:uncharacterized protein IWZ02DRAFT_494858 [Phyllosticta citriasiana]|uniref:uncharacterized protein n=1 Tax=Phyllosticta citriasiana TaxID=595635 RepID=UPI0030FDDBCC